MLCNFQSRESLQSLLNFFLRVYDFRDYYCYTGIIIIVINIMYRLR